MPDIWLLIATVVVCVLIYYLFISALLDNVFHAVASEPKIVPSYIPFFGFLFKFMKDPYEFVRWLHGQYGTPIVVNIMNRRHVFLNDQATFANRIAKDPTFTLDFLDDQFHHGGGVRWECIRNEEAKVAILKQYHEHLYGHELRILNHKTCQYLIKRLTEEKSSSSPVTVNIFDYIAEIMFDTAVSVLYGETFARSQHGFYASFQSYKSIVGTMMIEVPFKTFFLRSAFRQRDQFIERFIGLQPNEDMSKLILARIELMENFGEVFNEQDKAGLHAVFLWISLINTLPTACWCIVDLLLHPDAMEAAKNELSDKVTDISSLYEKETLGELLIMESCMQETMRRVILMLVQRQASAATVVTCMDGTQMGVRKGDIVVCPDIIKQFDPKVSLQFFILESIIVSTFLP